MNIANKKIKTIITDFDQTLWSGTIAEGEQPVLNKEYYRFLKRLHAKGVLLFGMTKNNRREVLAVLRNVGVDANIFIAIIANWDNKARNLALLFDQLKLRVDTTLFIDDNLLELSEAQSVLPGILTIQAGDWRRLKKNPFLNAMRCSANSVRMRYKRYRYAMRLFNAKRTFRGSEEEFLSTCNRVVNLSQPKSSKSLERVAELFYRTNRLNFYRRQLTSLDDAMKYLLALKETGHIIYAASISDAGVNLGIQAAFTLVHSGNTTLISNGTVSCSMISFGDLEKTIINSILQKLFLHSETVEILVKMTPTNSRIIEILLSFGFNIASKHKKDHLYRLQKNNYSPQKSRWIRTLWGPISTKYLGIPSVRDYFLRIEWPAIRGGCKVVMLGVGQGETLGTALTRRLERKVTTRGGHYYAVDIADYGNNIVADAGDLRSVFADKSIDYIICTELLEHVEHYWSVINEITRILRPGGRLFISVPYAYPKHEYPLDLWRFSVRFLRSTFIPYFRIDQIELEGSKRNPRRILMSLTRTSEMVTGEVIRDRGKVDWETGLTYL
ncbi:MAG: HAD-IIIC family phosphatase [Candidatus Zixiibacteriota bacterium]